MVVSVAMFNDLSTPAGSYAALKQWPEGSSSWPTTHVSSGDIATFFDNNQVIRLNWFVNYGYKTKCNNIGGSHSTSHQFPCSDIRKVEPLKTEGECFILVVEILTTSKHLPVAKQVRSE